MGDNLLSVVLANATNLANYDPNRSEVQLLLILRQCQVPEPKLLAPIIHSARRELVLDVQLLAEHDLQSSTDVFPLKLLQIQQSYQLLSGQDFLGPLLVEPEHLRLACEREVKTLLMRLRHLYLIQSGHRLSLRDTLVESVQGVFQLIRLRPATGWQGGPRCRRRSVGKGRSQSRSQTVGSDSSIHAQVPEPKGGPSQLGKHLRRLSGKCGGSSDLFRPDLKGRLP